MKRNLMIFVTIVVATALCQSQTLIRVPQDQPTIQAGINAASNGDTVLVDEGTYHVNLVLKKKIVLASLFITDGDTAHISKTILDGGSPAKTDSASVIIIGAGTDSTTVVVGFTIQNGSGTRIYDATSGWWKGGGGIFLTSGGASIRRNILTHNTMNSSDGVFGGGFAMWNTTAVMTDWVIEDNTIIDNTITSTGANPLGAEGGGAWVYGNGRFERNIVSRNVTIGGGYSRGGGMHLLGNIPTGSSNIIIANNLFRSNSSQIAGAIAMHSISTSSQPHVTLINNIIVENTATTAGAFQIISGDFTMINNTVAYNTAMDVAVSLAATRGTLAFRMLNNIFWDPGIVTELNTASNVSAGYNDVRGGLAGTGNINADPLFVTSDTLYRLQDTSPCIGAGTDSVTLGGLLVTAPLCDNMGNSRPSPPGSKHDLGAHESPLPNPRTSVLELEKVPQSFALSQNYPNPFNPTTLVRYSLPSQSRVRLEVFNILGQRVAVLVDAIQHAGVWEADWDASGMASGVYFCRLQVIGRDGTSTGSVRTFVETKKMLLLR